MGDLVSHQLTDESHIDGEFDPPIKQAPEPQREATQSVNEFDRNTPENNASVKLSSDFF